MPGVGVAPGFTFLFTSFGSGIPGVGVAPVATLPATFAGMPTVEFGDGGIGVVENSGGILLLFTAMFAFVLVFVLVCGDPQAKIKLAAVRSIASKNILNIVTPYNNF